MLRPVRTVAPASEPVTVAEAKSWLWVDHASHDTLIAALIAGAVAHLDGWAGILGRCMINSTWRASWADWPSDGDLRLPFPDVSSVVLKYFDSANTETTVSSALYEVLEDGEGAFIRFKIGFGAPTVNLDRSDGVQATIVAGFGANAAAVPQPIKSAICMLVAQAYAQREAGGPESFEPPFSVMSMLAPYRRNRI
jgi:uncharacterized phiE125 gp8 family phage protein